MRTRLLPYLALVTMLGFAINGSAQPAKTQSQNSTSSNAVGKVVDVQGRVSMRRRAWTRFVPAFIGTLLLRGDKLRFEGSSRAKIVCADKTVHNLAGGEQVVPCQTQATGPPVIRYRGSIINKPRGSAAKLPIEVISPRNTKLLDSRPWLRWTPVPGETTYKVTVWGMDLNWQTEVSSKTELRYPEEAPPLVAGETYKLTVTADGYSTDDEREPGLGFTVLNEQDVKTIRAAEKQIREMGLTDISTRLLIADLYTSWGLRADAIEYLESLASALKEPSVYRSLGALYLEIGLGRRAEERYVEALELSQANDDLEGQAMAYQILASIQLDLGNVNEAIFRLKKAIESYGNLGDRANVKELKKEIARLARLRKSTRS